MGMAGQCPAIHVEIDMLGFGPLGSAPLGAIPAELTRKLDESTRTVKLAVRGLIIPERPTEHGVLLKSTSNIWTEIVSQLGSDWSVAYQLDDRAWEELVAGAFSKAGYDEVVLTPRSNDHGRDVIATRHGVGCVKILGSGRLSNQAILFPTTTFAHCLE